VPPPAFPSAASTPNFHTTLRRSPASSVPSLRSNSPSKAEGKVSTEGSQSGTPNMESNKELAAWVHRILHEKPIAQCRQLAPLNAINLDSKAQPDIAAAADASRPRDGRNSVIRNSKRGKSHIQLSPREAYYRHSTQPSVGRTTSSSLKQGKKASRGSVPANPVAQPSEETQQTLEERERFLHAFKRFAINGDIEVDELHSILAALGHTHVEASWVQEIIAEQFNRRVHLDKYDFLEFASLYEMRFHKMMQQKFKDADLSGSGTISSGELSTLLRRLGITPVPGVVMELMFEVTGKQSCVAEVNEQEFEHIFNIVRDRAGFTRSEEAEFRSSFRRYDRNKDGEINLEELRSVLQWMGFPVKPDLMQEIVKDIRPNGSEDLSYSEFLNIMRVHRELHVAQIQKALKQEDCQLSGKISQDHLGAVFEEIGYLTATPELIKEIVSTCGLTEQRELMFEDIYLLMSEFRAREGMVRVDLKEVHEVFARFDWDASGDIDGIELAASARWLGYPQTVEQVQDILCDFAVDRKGQLTMEEFVKVCRRFHEDAIVKARLLFKEAKNDNCAALSSEGVRLVLLKMGNVIPLDKVEELMLKVRGTSTNVELWDFVRLVAMYRDEQRSKMRRNHGFNDSDVRRLHERFSRYDPGATGIVKRTNLAKLLEESFPEARINLESHARLRRLLKQVNSDKGELSWEDFLRMMRLVQDEADRNKFKRDQDAVASSGFSRSEVNEFRQVFQMFDTDASGEISFSELKSMLKEVVPLCTMAAKDLKSLLHQVDEDGNRELDFPEFLILMQKLQKENWNNINYRSAAIACGHREDTNSQWGSFHH